MYIDRINLNLEGFRWQPQGWTDRLSRRQWPQEKTVVRTAGPRQSPVKLFAGDFHAALVSLIEPVTDIFKMVFGQKQYVRLFNLFKPTCRTQDARQAAHAAA